MIQKIFSNRVIIIDEAHNFNPNSLDKKDKKETKKFSDSILKIIRYTNNVKLILATATPMNNDPTDIIWLLNLLL